MSPGPAPEAVSPLAELVREIEAAGGASHRWCYQCGTCDVVCPWNRVRAFGVRRLVRQAAFGIPDVESEDVWRCTTCGTCAGRCPRGVDPSEVQVAVRRLAVAYGSVPPAMGGLRSAARSLAGDGNPLGFDRARRDAWAEGLGVKPFAEGMEVLWFVGCYGSYDPRMQRVAVATARLLRRAGVDFGILGARETCCGQSARVAGHEDLFKRLARDNIKTFVDAGVRRILVSSPHCYDAFARQYRAFRVDFEVVHLASFLAELLAGGRLVLDREFCRRVTWHDPCYLGRHHGLYDAPREVLRRVPGLDLVEMPETREASLCCGGGGGRVWADTPKGERFSDLRVAQAAATGADVLATACPYCIGHFEESRLSASGGPAPLVMDLAEVALAATDGEAAP